MYPEGIFINQNKNNLVVFDKDLNNPSNEGFICFWKIIDSNKKQLVFKKRLTKDRALSKFRKLREEGWIQKKLEDKAA